jgi:hypothetical protein
MPTQERLRRHDKGAAPALASQGSTDGRQQHPVKTAESRSIRPAQNSELVAEDGVLDLQGANRAVLTCEESNERSEDQVTEEDHRATV